MRILILEDDQTKLEDLERHLKALQPNCQITSVSVFIDYIKAINQDQYDFLILDLIVPRRADSDDSVTTAEIIEATRGDFKCKNARTPGIALTGFSDKAEECFKELNESDLTVITYLNGRSEWEAALEKRLSCLAATQYYDFCVICALNKEADAFKEAGYKVNAPSVVAGLRFQEVELAGRTGVIVTAPRMGLVTAAITASQAILTFRPQVLCMSGICGGVVGQAKIYDTVIAETCHQHDSGKWEAGKLKPDVNSVQIEHGFAQKARLMIGEEEFLGRVMEGITLRRTEFPDGVDSFEPRVKVASASSGSAVLGDSDLVAKVKEQQRKCAIFEMESYAVYEAARLLPSKPQFFSAKTVVDDGSENKSDDFHRVGCLLSARVVAELLELCEFS